MNEDTQRPAYRYLEALPQDQPARLFAGIRWGLLFALPLWVLIFAVGFVISRAT